MKNITIGSAVSLGKNKYSVPVSINEIPTGVNAISLEIDYSENIVLTDIILLPALKDQQYAVSNKKYQNTNSMRFGWFSISYPFMGGAFMEIQFEVNYVTVDLTIDQMVAELADKNAQVITGVEYINSHNNISLIPPSVDSPVLKLKAALIKKTTS